MRIAMTLEVPFPPHPRVEKEMRSLTARGHDVHILSYAARSQPKVELVAGLGTVHRYPFPMSLRPFRLLYGCRRPYNQYWLSNLRHLAERVHPDTLHVHDLPLAWAARQVARERGIPLVLDFHENWPGFLIWAGKGYHALVRACVDYHGWERYEASAVTWADRIIVVDPSNRERLMRLYRVPAERFAVVSNTPDLEQLMPWLDSIPRDRTASDGQVTVLYMGGLDYGRGLQTVLDALGSHREAMSGVRLVIVGMGPYRQALEHQTRRLGLTDRVRFEGWQPYGELPRYLRSADIGIVPHVKDPLTETTIPNKIFEYMAGGLPVLSSDCAPMAAVLEKARCGLAFRSEDPADCASQLEALCKDSILRATLGESGKRAVLDEFNWAEAAAALVGVYDELEGAEQSRRATTPRSPRPSYVRQ